MRRTVEHWTVHASEKTSWVRCVQTKKGERKRTDWGFVERSNENGVKRTTRTGARNGRDPSRRGVEGANASSISRAKEHKQFLRISRAAVVSVRALYNYTKRKEMTFKRENIMITVSGGAAPYHHIII